MTAACECCGQPFEAKRSTARFCGATCRRRAHRRPGPTTQPETSASDFEAATRRELERLGQVDSMLGLQVLIVARRMSSGTETGSALATLSKEHSRLMAALAVAEKPADPVDEVGRRREEKLARATAR